MTTSITVISLEIPQVAQDLEVSQIPSLSSPPINISDIIESRSYRSDRSDDIPRYILGNATKKYSESGGKISLFIIPMN